MKHRPELDGLRGIAILAVLAAHTGVPGFADGGGGAGVTLFFVLSGYLITSLLLAERDKNGRVDLRAFYVRRALRLLPALAAVLVVVVVLLLAGLAPAAAVADTNYAIVIAGVVAYVANWVAVAGQSIGMLGHTWSLAVEEQFYIVWPAMLLAGRRFGRTAEATRCCSAVSWHFSRRAGTRSWAGLGSQSCWHWRLPGPAIRGWASRSSSFRPRPSSVLWQWRAVRRSWPGVRWPTSAASAIGCICGAAS